LEDLTCSKLYYAYSDSTTNLVAKDKRIFIPFIKIYILFLTNKVIPKSLYDLEKEHFRAFDSQKLGKRTPSVIFQVLSFILFSSDRKNFTGVNWAWNKPFCFWRIYVPSFVSLDIQQVIFERPELFMKVLMESVCLVASILNKNGMTREFFAKTRKIYFHGTVFSISRPKRKEGTKRHI